MPQLQSIGKSADHSILLHKTELLFTLLSVKTLNNNVISDSGSVYLVWSHDRNLKTQNEKHKHDAAHAGSPSIEDSQSMAHVNEHDIPKIPLDNTA